MKNLFHLLISFAIFSVIFFSINYFIPFFRKEQDAGKLLLKTVIAGIVYAVVVTILTNRRKKKDEEK
jgi:membrane protein DedA with SNARE-associated domain